MVSDISTDLPHCSSKYIQLYPEAQCLSPGTDKKCYGIFTVSYNIRSLELGGILASKSTLSCLRLCQITLLSEYINSDYTCVTIL